MTANLWGWGVTEAALDPTEVAAQASMLLGELQVSTAAPFDAETLPRARVEVPASLASFTTADPLARAQHTWGKSYLDRVRGFGGDFSAAPDLVAAPRTEAELEQVLAYCEREQLACIPFGGGTTVVAGIEARLGPHQRGAVTLDVRAMSKLLEVDEISRAVRAQAGVLGPALEKQLQPHGLTLRHYPQSFEFSTLGGWLATRAGGHFAMLFTHIDDLVQSVRMVTPRGTWQTRRLPASGAGPQPERLVLGSEGTLGVITEAWVRVQKRPRYRASASVHFEQWNDAVEATRAISQSGLYPTNCRLLDQQEVMMNQVAFDGSCVLLLGFESADHPLEPWIDRALAIAASHGGSCPKGRVLRDETQNARGTDAAEGWRAAFLRGPYLQDAMIQLGVMADTFETACTWRDFPTLFGEVTAGVRAALEKVCGGGFVSCRFTHVYPDGPAPYFTFVGKVKRGGERDAWLEVKTAASDALLRCGATITHHHAVGRTHEPWYRREVPAGFIAALKAVKREVDPGAILNPGVLFE